MFCLGIDSATKSTKALVLDTSSGDVVALAQCRYGTIAGLPPGHVEQDPATWIDAVKTTVTECLEKIGDRGQPIPRCHHRPRVSGNLVKR